MFQELLPELSQLYDELCDPLNWLTPPFCKEVDAVMSCQVSSKLSSR